MKRLNGKAIYSPAGKAGEYAEYACNFYNGCSNNCDYCYCKRGVLAHSLGGDTPTLKKWIKSDQHAITTLESELIENIEHLRKHGLFFSFTTDPLLPETGELTFAAVKLCLEYDVPVKILTKRSDFEDLLGSNVLLWPVAKKLVAIGFTLTGHDDLEPGASTNAERIEAMKKLHEAGFKTWASIEPVIDTDSSFLMICRTIDCCDLFKIGLQSGKKFNKPELIDFIIAVKSINQDGKYLRLYFKDSILEQAGIDRTILPTHCVGRDYDIFKS